MQQVNYFEILRSYNEFKIAKQAGAKANSLFYALLGKANTLRYPEKLTIYNSELLDLSGLTKDELYPARNKLTQVRIHGQAIIKYEAKGTRKPGIYEFNYEGFVNYFQNGSTYWLDNPTDKNKSENFTNDKSDNPNKPTTNVYTNSQTNEEGKSERLVGNSDTLLTKQNITNKTEEIQKKKYAIARKFHVEHLSDEDSGFVQQLLREGIEFPSIIIGINRTRQKHSPVSVKQCENYIRKVHEELLRKAAGVK